MRWQYWAIIILIISGAGYAVMREPRGIRNNNPGNIRHGADWQGMADVQSDKSFVTFKSPEYGVRAMARILRRYFYHYERTTVTQIIERWAPPVENDTVSYINAVSGALGVQPDETLNFESILPALIAEIIKHENGKQPYELATIQKGIALA